MALCTCGTSMEQFCVLHNYNSIGKPIIEVTCQDVGCYCNKAKNVHLYRPSEDCRFCIICGKAEDAGFHSTFLPQLEIGKNFIFFDKVVDEVIESIRAVLQKKGKEYSQNNDRFSNFRTAGRKLKCTPERALLGMKIKHTVSIDDIVDELDRGILPTKELLSEKIGDEINYLILLKGLILERLEK